MHFSRWLISPAALALAACGQASATTPDPSNDIDCSVLAFYFDGLAEHEGVPPSQKQATAAVHRWYSATVQRISQDQGANAVLSRAGPVLEAVKQDPMDMRDAHKACAVRAVNEGLR